MSIFGNIMGAIFGSKNAPASASSPTSSTQAGASPTPAQTTSTSAGGIGSAGG